MKKDHTRFAVPLDYQERVDSIHKIVKFLLNDADGELNEKVKRRFLDRCIWQLTEARGHGKYDLQYVSEEAKVRVETQERGWKKGLRHDHVWTRQSLRKRLESSATQLSEILMEAVGCVVTVDEHKRLSVLHPDVNGWDRYRKAKVRVFDRMRHSYLGW